METRTEKRTKLQTPTLVAIVIGLHVTAVGSVIFIQGCGTSKPQVSEPPVTVVMPPSTPVQDVARPHAPAPVFKPSVSVEPAARTMPEAAPEMYEVRPGDSLSVIARRHGVSSASIIDLNKIKDPNKIRVGQKLLLPVGTSVTPPSAPAPAQKKASPVASAPVLEGGSVYVVQAGDSLSGIARRHGITTARLSEVNKISDPNKIVVGQKLTIPGSSASKPDSSDGKTTAPDVLIAPVPAPAPVPMMTPDPSTQRFSASGASFEYEVRAGDTLESIASDFTVLRGELISLNNLSGTETLQPGQKLLIPPMPQP